MINNIQNTRSNLRTNTNFGANRLQTVAKGTILNQNIGEALTTEITKAQEINILLSIIDKLNKGILQYITSLRVKDTSNPKGHFMSHTFISDNGDTVRLDSDVPSFEQAESLDKSRKPFVPHLIIKSNDMPKMTFTIEKDTYNNEVFDTANEALHQKIK